MGITKRIFIDKDPAYEGVRRQLAEEALELRSQFTFRIAAKQKNPNGKRPYWDPIWPYALARAASDLQADSININSGMFLRTEEECAAVLALAKEIWRDQIERHRPARPNR